MKPHRKAIVLFGRVITLETLKLRCHARGHSERYADTLWFSYWRARDNGFSRDQTLQSLLQICFTEEELTPLIGKPIQEK